MSAILLRLIVTGRLAEPGNLLSFSVSLPFEFAALIMLIQNQASEVGRDGRLLMC